MPMCRACRRFLRGDVETVGARCRYCHEPLYEHPLVSAGGGRGRDDTVCALHAGNGAVGTCSRCGNFICAVCRTTWHESTVCPACLERAMESGEAVPSEKRANWWQAVLALVLGTGGWAVMILGFVVMIIGIQDGFSLSALGAGSLMFIGSVAFSIVAVGLAAAAIRARGGHMIVATIGLVLGGLHVGTLIGMLCLSLWMNQGG
jgi:hypothetical protein